MARPLTPATEHDVTEVRHALALLRDARRYLDTSPQALTKVNSAIKSTEGALRHVQRRADVTATREHYALTGVSLKKLIRDAADSGPFMVSVELESGEVVRTAKVHSNRTGAAIQARKIQAGGIYRGQRVVKVEVEPDTRPAAVIAAQNATAAR